MLRRSGIAVLAFLAVSAARADFIEDTRICISGHGPTDEIAPACTRLIESGQYTGWRLAEIYVKRGDAHWFFGDDDVKAIEDYDSATTVFGSYIPALQKRGQLFLMKKDHQGAISAYDRALDRDPGNSSLYVSRADIYHAAGNLDRALTDIDRALQVNPTYAGAYHSRGIYFREAGRHEESISDLTRALEILPGYPFYHFDIGKTYYAAGKTDIGNEHLEQACEKASPELLLAWQSILQRLEYYEGALDGVCGRGTKKSLRACARDNCDF